MELRPLECIRNEANVVAFVPPTRAAKRAQRRDRLERFALLLETSQAPIQLFQRIEYMPDSARRRVRTDASPLAVAFRDPVLRAHGLAGDRLGDAIQFFHLSQGEAHHLLCDCHYVGTVTPGMVAQRARMLANRLTFRDVIDKLAAALKIA